MDGAQRALDVSAVAGAVLPARYRLVRRIAEGGMAAVWRARDQTLEREVAIKLLSARFLHDEMAVRRFKREARTAAQLSGHPNVVTIFDVGQAEPTDHEPGQPFIVMEYLAGGTVAEALRAGAVDPAQTLTWVKQAAAGLDYAHSRGVVHRDVKLSNFLLDHNRVLYVADFGIARLGTDDTLTGTGQVIGTAGYLAPERALGHPATEASDRYALAVAAFELLVGERPFTADNFAAQARAHLEEPPPAASLRNRSLPPALDAVLERGMAKRPEDRYPSATAFAEDLETALTRHAGVAAAATAATSVLPRRAPAQARPAAAAGSRPAAARARPGAGRAAGAARSRAPSREHTESARRTRLVAFAALTAVLLGVAIALAAGGGTGVRHLGSSARKLTSTARHATTSAARSAPGSTASTPSTTPAATGPASSTALEAQG